MVQRTKSMFMLVVLLFAMMTGGLQVAVAAPVEATVQVIGSNGESLSDTPVTYEVGATAFDLLISAVGEENVGFEVYDGLGTLVTAIDGIENNTTDHIYWMLYINGIAYQSAADQYLVQPNDVITFKYEGWNPNSVSIEVIDNNGDRSGSEWPIAFIGQPSALQLLQVFFGPENIGLSEGNMIQSINGLVAENPYYWAFYIDGKAAMVGADSYPLNAGDNISFKYESFEPVTEEPKEGSDAPALEEYSKESLNTAVNSASDYVLKNQVGEWEAIALKQAGKTIPKSYLTGVTQTIKDAEGKFRKITDYERYTLGILAAGGDPTNIAGYNLVEAIYNGDVAKQGLNGVAYALIALDSSNFEIPSTAKWTREELIQELLSKQNADGGWSWDGSETSDGDTTAMVLTALAPYKDQAEVQAKIDEAVSLLSTQFLNSIINNSSTAAQVVIALSSLGLDANGELFTKSNGDSLIEFLLSFQNADGGFDWQGGDASDAFSTDQGFRGIVAYQLFVNGKQSLYSLPLEIKEDVGKPLPNTAVNTYNLILLGALLLFIGAAFFVIEKRKKA